MLLVPEILLEVKHYEEHQSHRSHISVHEKHIKRDFPGGPGVGTSPCSAGGAGSIPGQGAKISHASRPKNQNMKQKQYCNKFNKDLKQKTHEHFGIKPSQNMLAQISGW